ncbi:MAG: hypothetical protein J6K52_01860 [Clostridia bacterium]|nr:hypothetical protein [Clostridia bacterium]
MEKELYTCTIWYKAVDLEDDAICFLSLDCPKSIKNDLKNGFVPAQIDNIIQNIVLLQGFASAVILRSDVEELPFDYDSIGTLAVTDIELKEE